MRPQLFFLALILLFSSASALTVTVSEQEEDLRVTATFTRAEMDVKGLNFIDILRVSAQANDLVTGKAYKTDGFLYEGHSSGRIFVNPGTSGNLGININKADLINALKIRDPIRRGHPISLTVSTQVQGANKDLWVFVLTADVLDGGINLDDKDILYSAAQKEKRKTSIDLSLSGNQFTFSGSIFPNGAGLKALSSGTAFPSKLYAMIYDDSGDCRLYSEVDSLRPTGSLSNYVFSFSRSLNNLARRINALEADGKLDGNLAKYVVYVKSSPAEDCTKPKDFFIPVGVNLNYAIPEVRLEEIKSEVLGAKNSITLERVDDAQFNIVVTTPGDGVADAASVRFAAYASADEHVSNYRATVGLSDRNLQAAKDQPRRFIIPISKQKLKTLADSKGVAFRNARLILELTSSSLPLEPADDWSRKKELDDSYPAGQGDDYYRVAFTPTLDFAMDVAPTALDVDSIRVVKVDQTTYQVVATTSGDGTADRAQLFIAGYASASDHPAAYSHYQLVGDFSLESKKTQPRSFTRTITLLGITAALDSMKKLPSGSTTEKILPKNARFVLVLTSSSVSSGTVEDRKQLVDGKAVPGKYFKLKFTDTLDKLPAVSSVTAITDSIRVEKAPGGKYRVIATRKGDGTADLMRVLLIGLSDSSKATKHPVNYEYVKELDNSDASTSKNEPRVVQVELSSDELTEALKKMQDKTGYRNNVGDAYPFVTVPTKNAMFALELTSSSATGSGTATLSDPATREKLAKGEYVSGLYLVFRTTDYLDRVLPSAGSPVKTDGGRGVLYYCLRPFDGQIIGQSSPCLSNCLLGEMRVADEVAELAKTDFKTKSSDQKKKLVKALKDAQRKLPGTGVQDLLKNALAKPEELAIVAKREGSVAYSIGGLSSPEEFRKYLAGKFGDSTGFWTNAPDAAKRMKRIEGQSCKCDANDYFIKEGGIGSTPIGKYCGVEKSSGGDAYDVKTYSLEGVKFLELSPEKTRAASERDLAKLRSASKQITLYPVTLSSSETRFKVSNQGGRPLADLSAFGLRMADTPYGVGTPGKFKPFERVFLAGKDAGKDACVSLSPTYSSNAVLGTLVKNLESIDLKMNLAACSDLSGSASFVAIPVVASPFYFLLPVEFEKPLVAFVLENGQEAFQFQEKVLAPDGKFTKGIFKDSSYSETVKSLQSNVPYVLLTSDNHERLAAKAKKDKKPAPYNLVLRLPTGYGTKEGFSKWEKGTEFIANAIASVPTFLDQGAAFDVGYDGIKITVAASISLKDGEYANFKYDYKKAGVAPWLTLDCPDGYVAAANLFEVEPAVGTPSGNSIPMSKRGGAGSFDCTLEDRNTGKKAKFKVTTTAS